MRYDQCDFDGDKYKCEQKRITDEDIPTCMERVSYDYFQKLESKKERKLDPILDWADKSSCVMRASFECNPHKHIGSCDDEEKKSIQGGSTQLNKKGDSKNQMSFAKELFIEALKSRWNHHTMMHVVDLILISTKAIKQRKACIINLKPNEMFLIDRLSSLGLEKVDLITKGSFFVYNSTYKNMKNLGEFYRDNESIASERIGQALDYAHFKSSNKFKHSLEFELRGLCKNPIVGFYGPQGVDLEDPKLLKYALKRCKLIEECFKKLESEKSIECVCTFK